MQLENLSDLFQRCLELAWDCEHQLVAEFPRLAEAVDSAELRQELVQREQDTRDHINRLHQVFTKLKRSPIAEASHQIRDIGSEAGKVIKHVDRSPLRDAALISLINQASHYKIALYGSACAFARALGRHDLAGFLEATLDREKIGDRILTTLAEGSINPQAASFHNGAPFAFI